MDIRLCPIAAIFLLTFAIGAAPVRASLMWEFGYVGEVDGFAGTGFIEFATSSSVSTSDVASFSYSGTCAGHDCDFGLSDLRIAVWTIDDNWEMVELNVLAFARSLPDFGLEMSHIFFQTTCFSDGTACNGSGFDDRVSLYESEDAYLSPVHVPTPATLTLFGVGLMGFGISRRKRALHR
jgi:hypothetical protein